MPGRVDPDTKTRAHQRLIVGDQDVIGCGESGIAALIDRKLAVTA
ncbi:hypothetical protein [Nocardia vaccinii]|nr:hypothetical protein [Nocardia vaccinii]